MMALVGAVALLGADGQSGHSAGGPNAAAGARVVERRRGRAGGGARAHRPVLMTTCTTVAGLWPLALTTGREMEIWPPFATVMMGGLATSTLLTLLVIPVGFVLLHRLDAIFGRARAVGHHGVGVGHRRGHGAAGHDRADHLADAGRSSPRCWSPGILGRRRCSCSGEPRPPEPEAEDGPPAVDVRFLPQGVRRCPGPIGGPGGSARDFSERVLARGGRPFEPRNARQRLVHVGRPVARRRIPRDLSGEHVLAGRLLVCRGALLAGLLVELRRARGKVR